MRNFPKKSVTLVELLISIVLIGLVILGLSNIELFCRNQLISSERRIQVQNEASLILEHMSKHIGQAISNPDVFPISYMATPASTAWPHLRILVDTNHNGKLDLPVLPAVYGPDSWVEYSLRNTYTLGYCGSVPYPNAGGGACASGYEILSRHVRSGLDSSFVTFSTGDNYLSVNITTCWDPDGVPDTCGSIKNPSVSMQSRIYMPSVATR
jgi:hypothetical protein